MSVKSITIAGLLSLAAATSVFAQATQTQPTTQPAPRVTQPAAPAAQPAPRVTQPAQPAAPAAQPAPRVTQPAQPAAPAAPAAQPAQRPAANQSALVNLNTAPESELDKLPQIGEARAKAIIAKRPYRDWNDFVAKNVIPANAEAAIKDKVRFR
jgi:DNA uptake protein ComE-like DNA-binding protein